MSNYSTNWIKKDDNTLILTVGRLDHTAFTQFFDEIFKTDYECVVIQLTAPEDTLCVEFDWNKLLTLPSTLISAHLEERIPPKFTVVIQPNFVSKLLCRLFGNDIQFVVDEVQNPVISKIEENLYYEDATYAPNDFHSGTPSYINHYDRPSQ